MKRIITAATVAVLTIGSLAGCAAVTAAGAPHPTVTVTVTADPVTTGVDQSTYDACKAAYRQVVTLLAKQTNILQGVSFAASAGFTAVANGDAAALSSAVDQVTTYSGQESALSDQVTTVDRTACQ